MMLEEKNRATLQRAIRQLPQYKPGEGVWAAVEDALDRIEEGERLQASLHLLPSYEPPQKVWEHIQEELDSDVAEKERPAGVRRLLLYWRQLAASASVLLLLGVGWGLISKADAPTVTVVESEAVLPADMVSHDWNADEAMFEQVLRHYAEHPFLEQDPQIRNLKQELEELNEAKSEIEEMMERYGDDPDLIRQIGEIERQRSEVVKRMVAFI
jgi:DNA repair exonuclease SbcCD ATPase subunit